MEAPKSFRKRNAILSALRSTKCHPSAEMVYGILQQTEPDISLATVYRNLSLFKSQGLIQSLGTVGGAERFDGDTSPHVHFICTGCHCVTDLPGLSIPENLGVQAAQCVGGQVTDCQLTFSGLCGDCIQENTNEY